MHPCQLDCARPAQRPSRSVVFDPETTDAMEGGAAVRLQGRGWLPKAHRRAHSVNEAGNSDASPPRGRRNRSQPAAKVYYA